jgi:hypothetical protein
MITDLQVYTLHDALPTFLDTNGKPVIGRIIFYEADGTTFKAIYSDQNYNVELPNPLLTNLAGQPEAQPFLKNGVYRVVVEKFIGNNLADMADYQYERLDPEHLGEVSHWEFDKEFVIDSGRIDEEQTTQAYIATVETIAELRQLSFNEYKYATVIDYDENIKGITPRTYVWNANSSRNEDYGATIISSLSDVGRWELLESATLDSTTFGVSPYTDMGVLQSRLNGLANYTMSNYRKAQMIYWKPGVYRLDNGANISIGIPVTCYGQLKFMTPNGLSRISFQGGIEYPRKSALVDENTTLVIRQDVVHSSWFTPTPNHNLTFDGNTALFNTIIADNVVHPRQTFRNLNVQVEDPTQVVIANNCNIQLNTNLTSNGSVFSNCRFDQGVGKFVGEPVSINGTTTIYPWMFANNYNVYAINLGQDVTYSVEDWGAQRYADLKLNQDKHLIGNLNEGTIDITFRYPSDDASDVYVIENGMGTIDLDSKYINLELHNFSGTIKNVRYPSTLNLIDCWVNIEGDGVDTLALRRGSISKASGGIAIQSALLVENGDINLELGTMTASSVVIRNSRIYKSIIANSIELRDNSIYAIIAAKNVELTHNQIYATIDQSDIEGVITVNCTGNMFHLDSGNNPARHYIHSFTPNAVVNGMWANNGSSYDTIHWIRIDRTNLKLQDNDHHYSYMNNAEPFLQKYSGRNHPMRFPLYSGSRFSGRGVFATTSMPFSFINRLTKEIFVVPRSIYWKCFTVGRGYLARSGTIRCSWSQGIFEDDYVEHHTGDITGIYTWGSSLVVSNQYVNNGQRTGYGMMVSRDADGEAEYNVSFEAENADHTTSEFSNGVLIGYIDRDPYDGWNENFAVYPASPMSTFNIFVYMDNNFISGVTTPMNYDNV